MVASGPPRFPALTEIAGVAEPPAPPSARVPGSDLAPVLETERRFHDDHPSLLPMSLLPGDGEEGGSSIRKPHGQPPAGSTRRLPRAGFRMPRGRDLIPPGKPAPSAGSGDRPKDRGAVPLPGAPRSERFETRWIPRLHTLGSLGISSGQGKARALDISGRPPT